MLAFLKNDYIKQKKIKFYFKIDKSFLRKLIQMFLLIELSKVSKAYNFREHKIIEMIYCDRFKIKIEV